MMSGANQYDNDAKNKKATEMMMTRRRSSVRCSTTVMRPSLFLSVSVAMR